MTVKPLYLLFFGVLLQAACLPLQAQEKLIVTAGAGIPELLNVSLRYQLPQTQVGLSYGTAPVKNETIYTLSGDLFFHFAGKSLLTERRVWYGRTGLTYLKDETPSVIDKYLYLNLRGGRDLNITSKAGFAVDLGIGIELYYKEIEKVPQNNWFDLNFEMPVIPALSVSFFYRI